MRATQCRGAARHTLAGSSLCLATPLNTSPRPLQAADAAIASVLSALDAGVDRDAAALAWSPPQQAVAAVAGSAQGLEGSGAALRSAVLGATQGADCEAVDHPVACAWPVGCPCGCVLSLSLAFSLHSVPGLLVQSSTCKGDPVRAFTDMFRGGNMPSVLRAGAWRAHAMAMHNPQLTSHRHPIAGLADPMLLRHHLVLHDAATSAAGGEAMCATVRSQFGPTACSLLVLNSRHLPDAPPSPPVADIWTSARVARLGGPAAGAAGARVNPLGVSPGAALTAEDVARVSSFLAEFAAQQVIPFLENKVVTLSASIAAARKGLRNTLKSLWRGSTKEPRAAGAWELPPEGAYPHTQPEAQIRLCADLALMLRDTETAVGHFRLCIPDFRADKAHRQLGAAYEALGLALVCGGEQGSASLRREVETAFEAAWVAHKTAASPWGPRLALRAALLHAWAVASLRDGRLAGAGATPTTRAAGEGGVSHSVAAHLLEASSAALLVAQPPRVRRAAMQAVLAGHRHSLGGARGGAVRAYALACSLLGTTPAASPRWRAAQAHVHFALARHLAHGGELGDAMAHLVAQARLLDAAADAALAGQDSLAGAASAAVSHAAYLRELLFVAGSLLAGSPQLAWDLAVPRVDTRKVFVVAEDARGFANHAARRVPDDAWTAMESGAVTGGGGGMTPAQSSSSLASLGASAAEAPLTSLVPPDLAVSLGGTGAGNWLDGGGQRAGDAQWASCVAGEAVAVHVRLVNPLASTITVGQLRLEAVFWDAAVGEQAQGAALECPSQTCTLGPGEQKEAVLLVTPPSPGRMHVTACVWHLLVPGLGDSNGTGAPCRSAFAVAAPLRRRSQGAWLPDVPPTSRLQFRVGSPMPKLSAALEGVPESTLEGAVLRCCLSLTNVGPTHLGRLRLAVSHPCLIPGSAPLTGGLGDWTWDDLRSDAGVPPPTQLAMPQTTGRPLLFAFPDAHATLAPSSSLRWPLWLHARDADALRCLRLSILYAPTAAAAAAEGGSTTGGTVLMRHRILRLVASVQLRPVMAHTASVAPSEGRSGGSVLGVSVTHAGAHHLRTLSLRCLSLLPPARHGAALRPLGRLGAVAAGATLSGDGASTSVYLSLTRTQPEAGEEKGHPDVVLCPCARGETPGSAASGVLALLAGRCVGGEAPGGVGDAASVAAPASMPLALLWDGDAVVSGGESGSPMAPQLVLLHGLTLLSAPRTGVAGAAVVACLRGPSTCTVGDVVPLHVEVTNASHVPLTCRLTLNPGDPGARWSRILPPDAHPDTAPPSLGLPGSSAWLWVGLTQRETEPIQPGATARLPVSLLVLAPGVHNLNRWTLAWQLEGGAPGAGGGVQAHNHPFLLTAN